VQIKQKGQSMFGFMVSLTESKRATGQFRQKHTLELQPNHKIVLCYRYLGKTILVP